MFYLDLQMFGGGGSKSGLGGSGGGGGSGRNGEQKVFIFNFQKKDGTLRPHPIKARTKEEAIKKADKYQNEEGYKGHSKPSEPMTIDQFNEKYRKNKK